MEKIKVRYIGPYTSTLRCDSYIGLIKKGDVIKLSERELSELDDNFEAVDSDKKKKNSDLDVKKIKEGLNL